MITVVITEWFVPFNQTVTAIRRCKTDKEALSFINKSARKWFNAHEGKRAVKEKAGEAFKPIKELGYDEASWELWDGEEGFHAFLDSKTEARLHHAHYKREFTDKGEELPGYLQTAYLFGNRP